MKNRRTFIWLLLILALLAAGGCGSAPAEEAKTGSGDGIAAKSTENAEEHTSSAEVMTEGEPAEAPEKATPGGAAVGASAETPQNTEKTQSAAARGSAATSPEGNGGGADGNSAAAYTCTISIDCKTILDNMDDLTKGKESQVPADGVILPTTSVTFEEGDSVFDVLLSVTKAQKIHFEFVDTPVYDSAYIEGIHNLYEFDCGNVSGWEYSVNGVYPGYGCSMYALQDGDVIVWRYTCDLGRDL